MQRFYRNHVQAFFTHLDVFIRLLANRRAKRRFAIVGTYLKIRFLELLVPRRRKPIKVLGWRVSYGSLFFLRHTYREIFIERLYARHQLPGAKRIIDAGANIGIATLWYRLEYPDAEIIAFEPDPRTCEILETNVRQNGLKKVTVHNLAVADKAGTLQFYFDSTLPGGDVAHSVNREFRASLDDHPTVGQRSVKAVPLRDYLNRPTDILKVDIEGSEVPALRTAADRLKNVRLIQMEYHYLPKRTLSELLAILEKAGRPYRVYLDGPLENKLGSVAMIYSAREGTLPE